MWHVATLRSRRNSRIQTQHNDNANVTKRETNYTIAHHCDCVNAKKYTYNIPLLKSVPPKRKTTKKRRLSYTHESTNFLRAGQPLLVAASRPPQPGSNALSHPPPSYVFRSAPNSEFVTTTHLRIQIQTAPPRIAKSSHQSPAPHTNTQQHQHTHARKRHTNTHTLKKRKNKHEFRVCVCEVSGGVCLARRVVVFSASDCCCCCLPAAAAVLSTIHVVEGCAHSRTHAQTP